MFQPRTFNFQGGQIFPWHIGTKYVNPALGAGYIIRYVHPMKWANNYHNGYTHKVSNMQPRNITLIQVNIIYKYSGFELLPVEFGNAQNWFCLNLWTWCSDHSRDPLVIRYGDSTLCI